MKIFKRIIIREVKNLIRWKKIRIVIHWVLIINSWFTKNQLIKILVIKINYTPINSLGEYLKKSWSQIKITKYKISSNIRRTKRKHYNTSKWWKDKFWIKFICIKILIL